MKCYIDIPPNVSIQFHHLNAGEMISSRSWKVDKRVMKSKKHIKVVVGVTLCL